MRIGLLGLWLLLLLPSGLDSEYAASQTKTLIGIDSVEVTAIAELADDTDDNKDTGDSAVSRYVAATIDNTNTYSHHSGFPKSRCPGTNNIRAPPGSFLT